MELINVHRFVTVRAIDLTNQFEHNEIRTSRASRECFAFANGDRVREAMSGVRYAINPALRNSMSGFKFQRCHSLFQKRQAILAGDTWEPVTRKRPRPSGPEPQ